MAISIKLIDEARRRAYQDLTCGFELGDEAPDPAAPYWKIVSEFSGYRPLSAHAHAQALLRLIEEDGGEGWIYTFGVPELFSHVGVLARSPRGLLFCDAFTGLGFSAPIQTVLTGLSDGQPLRSLPPKGRKVCVVDAEQDRADLIERLAAIADRELVGSLGQRAFLVDFTPEVFWDLVQMRLTESRFLFDATPTLSHLLLYPISVRGSDGAEAAPSALPDLGDWFQSRQSGERAALVQKARGKGSLQMTDSSRGHGDPLVTQLRLQLEAAEHSRRASERELGTVTALIGELRSALAEDRQRSTEATAQVDRVQAKAREDLDVAEQRLVAAHEEIAAAGRAAEQDRAARARALEDLAETRAKLLTAEADLDQARHEVASVRQARDAARHTLQEDRGVLEREIGALRERVLKSNAELNDALAEQMRLGDELERSERRLQQLRSAVEDTEREAQSLRSGIVDRDTKLALRDQQAVELQRRLDDAAAALALAQEELEAQAAARAQAQKELEAQAAASAKVQKELEAQAAASATVQKELEAQTAASAQVQEELEAQAAASAKVQKELEAQAAASATVQKELEAQTAASAKVQEELEAQAAANAEAREAFIAQAAASAEALTAQEAEITELAQSVLNLEVELADARATNDARFAQLQEASARIHDLSEVTAQAEGRRALELKRREEERRLHAIAQRRLEDELQAVRAKLNQLQAELGDAAQNVGGAATSGAYFERVAAVEGDIARARQELAAFVTVSQRSRYLRFRRVLQGARTDGGLEPVPAAPANGLSPRDRLEALLREHQLLEHQLVHYRGVMERSKYMRLRAMVKRTLGAKA